MKKFITQTGAMLTVGMLAAAALTGCRKESSAPVESTTAEKTAEAAETEQEKNQESGSITISTSRGDVEVPLNPKRVAVFDMAVLDSLDDFGVDLEVAVPTANLLTGLSKYESSVNAGSIKEPDMEAIYGFDPELIIISNRQEPFYDELSKIAPTWYVGMEYTNLMAEFTENYRTLGRIFDKEDAVEEALKNIQQQIETVKGQAEQMDEKALILLTNDGNISAYGAGSRFGLIHDVLGVKAADDAIDASTHGQSVGYEYVAEVNPDILFVVDRTAVVAGTTGAGDTLDNDLVKSTNAYKNNKIVYLDPENWYIAGPGLNTLPKMIMEVEEGIK